SLYAAIVKAHSKVQFGAIARLKGAAMRRIGGVRRNGSFDLQASPERTEEPRPAGSRPNKQRTPPRGSLSLLRRPSSSASHPVRSGVSFRQEVCSEISRTGRVAVRGLTQESETGRHRGRA